ncbi:MAG: glycosyltransferase family 4 protein [Acidimicrobiia bacterium]|nr:glycosyltransferase family 4 protein [Acidimicrobiia bacterium]
MSEGRTFVFVINSLGAGGAERSLADILPHLPERGVHPLVVCFKAPEVGFEREVRDAGTEVVVLPSGGLLRHIRPLRRIIRRRRPALVYTALFDAHFVGRLAAVGTGVPVLSNLTNVAYDPARFADPRVNTRKLRMLRTIDGWTARHLTAHFHAVSGAVKDSAVTHLGIAGDDVTVVYRGRGRERLGAPGPERRRAVREKLGIPQQAPVVVTVGRQEYQKGHRHLLAAVPALREQFPDLVVLIVGREGHCTGDLCAIVAELQIEEHVRFLGHRTDVADLLSAADVFAFPSVYEGLGGANLEAMAMGLPMVVSDIPALREVVAEGENGLLVPPGDPDALGGAIAGLLADPELRTRYGTRSIEIYEESFQATESIPRTVDLMVRVADAGR